MAGALIAFRDVIPILLVLLGGPLTGCATGPSPARVACLNDCATEKDSCMLAAQTAEMVSSCDSGSRSCAAQCPES